MTQPDNENHPTPRSLLTEEQLDRFHDDLVEERAKMRESLARLHRESIQENSENLGGMAVRSHLADLGSETFEQEENLGLALQVSRVLTAIERALERMEQRSYGLCESCGSPIPGERLEAIPYATRCAACQSQVEKGVDLS